MSLLSRLGPPPLRPRNGGGDPTIAKRLKRLEQRHGISDDERLAAIEARIDERVKAAQARAEERKARQREYMRQWRERNADYVKRQRKLEYETNREAILARAKARRAAQKAHTESQRNG